MDIARTVSIGQCSIYHSYININILIPCFCHTEGRESYKDLNEHIRSKKHIGFAQNEENFKELQAFACSLYSNQSRKMKRKHKRRKTEIKNVYFCGKMDIEGENNALRTERSGKHLPQLIDNDKTKDVRIKDHFTGERPSTCTGVESSKQQEIIRNHRWSSHHRKNQKVALKYPVPPPQDITRGKRKKRCRPYSSNDICHPRIRDANQENSQNPSVRAQYVKKANSKVFSNNKARRLRPRPVNYNSTSPNHKS